MRRSVSLVIVGMMLSAGAVLAQGVPDEPRVYAYPGENFCPTGLRPVTIDGVISCGTPNRSLRYSAMKATAAVRHEVAPKR